MAVFISEHRGGFGPGRTEITRASEDDAGIGLCVLRLAEGTVFDEEAETETAWLLMEGRARARAGGKERLLARASLFDDLPSCVHVGKGERVRFECLSAVELTVFTTPNEASFPPEIYLPDRVRNERRGKGRLNDASFRFVRTIFDGENAHPNAKLVLGEVVTLPGRWSSYPPHHHPQPEIYHYRFTHPEGYGHAELGEQVFKVRAYDTIKILGARDHAQCAAPGYGMYYAWVIRHLPEARYTVPEFTEAHRWTMTPGAKHWWPADEE